ncbi:MAG TPA: hypothetical protein VFN10_08550, partial [Thermoanaerobaculia bacterium]|nr:hypothetical protein [Thermoanaerobaculia bacterium]
MRYAIPAILAALILAFVLPMPVDSSPRTPAGQAYPPPVYVPPPQPAPSAAAPAPSSASSSAPAA